MVYLNYTSISIGRVRKIEVTLPDLYKQDRIYFFVPSEQLFSKTGAIKTQVRNRLSSTRLDKLLFLGDFPEEC